MAPFAILKLCRGGCSQANFSIPYVSGALSLLSEFKSENTKGESRNGIRLFVKSENLEILTSTAPEVQARKRMPGHHLPSICRLSFQRSR